MSELYELYLNKAATKITGYHAKQTKEARHILAILIRQMETKGFLHLDLSHRYGLVDAHSRLEAGLDSSNCVRHVLYPPPVSANALCMYAKISLAQGLV